MTETSKRVEPGEDRGGEWVEMSGKEYKVPPLNFKALREVQEKIATIGKIEGAPTPEQMDVVVDVVAPGLSPLPTTWDGPVETATVGP